MVRMLLITLAFAICLTKIYGLQVGFGEIDYRENEGAGGVNVVVQKLDENFGPLFLKLKTVPFGDVPSDRRPGIVELPRAAQYEEDGRQDFVPSIKNVSFEVSTVQEEQTIFVPFNDDDINEPPEGFFAILELDEERSDPRDVADYIPIRNGITLIVVKDDDLIELAFNRPSYTVEEGDKTVDDVISIIKVDDRLTEQELEIIVELAPPVAASADLGLDYNITTFQTLTLSPDEQSVFVPFDIFDDEIAELEERFNIFLGVPENKALYDLVSPSSADIYIRDDEVSRIGFTSTVYFVNESDGNAEVCLEVFGEYDFFAFGMVQVEAITANNLQNLPANESADFFGPFLPNGVVIEVGLPSNQFCFSITIFDDDIPEDDETLAIRAFFEETDISINVNPQNATIVIRGNDQPMVDPCSLCHNDGQCVPGPEDVMVCICNHGYRGNGQICSNINECAEGLDSCDVNADCLDTDGGYTCACRPGYIGDGFTCEIQPCPVGFRRVNQVCQNINECAEGIHNCDPNAQCSDRFGFFVCRCNFGYIGDGNTCTLANPPTPEPPMIIIESPANELPFCDEIASDTVGDEEETTGTTKGTTRGTGKTRGTSRGATRTRMRGRRGKRSTKPDADVPCIPRPVVYCDEIFAEEEESATTRGTTKGTSRGTSRGATRTRRRGRRGKRSARTRANADCVPRPVVCDEPFAEEEESATTKGTTRGTSRTRGTTRGTTRTRRRGRRGKRSARTRANACGFSDSTKSTKGTRRTRMRSRARGR